jgi:protein-S-isoprenylcysteine O-methyltransferase Ste14
MTPYTESTAPVRRAAVVAYGVVAYLLFLGVFTYAVGFLAGVGVPKAINDGPDGPAAVATLVNAGLLGLFGVQHSVMARPWFKRWLTGFVPPRIERSTYVLASALVVALLFWQWRPLPVLVWSVEAGWAAASLWTLKGLGIVLLIGSTFAIDHLKMFGVRQVMARARSRHAGTGLRGPWLHRLVRHPIMVGFLVAFWVAPRMSAGQLLFNVMATGYILVAVRWQERDLHQRFGEEYEVYTRQVPRFIPRVPGLAPTARD